MAFKTVTEISYEQVTKSKVVCEQDCTWAQIYDLGTLLCNEAIEQMKARQPVQTAAKPTNEETQDVVVTDSPV